MGYFGNELYFAAMGWNEMIDCNSLLFSGMKPGLSAPYLLLVSQGVSGIWPEQWRKKKDHKGGPFMLLFLWVRCYAELKDRQDDKGS